MGWNEGYTAMEKTVVSVYDTGVLTKELLNELMQPYGHSDIDSGGCMDLRSKDGLSAEEIVCKIMEPERFAEIKPIPEEMPEYVSQTKVGFTIPAHEGHTYDSWQEALEDERNCKLYELWNEITRREWDFY